MIRIKKVLAVPATGTGSIEQQAETVSVGLVLDGAAGAETVAWGDCVAADSVSATDDVSAFRAADGIALIDRVVAPALEGRPLAGFRELAAEMDALIAALNPADLLAPREDSSAASGLSRRDVLSPGKLLHAVRLGLEESAAATREAAARLHSWPGAMAVRYGLSQAILSAVAAARGLTMAEVIAEEWGLPLPAGAVSIHIEADNDDLDQMIAHRVASLPHRLLDDATDQPGTDGVFLTRRVRALAERIQALGGPDYHPIIHIDAHGALGRISDENTGRILGHLYALENAARPYLLRVEDPAVMDSQAAQVDLMKRLMDYVQVRRMGVQIVAGTWARTVEDIRAFVDAGAAHMIAISMPHLCSVHNSVDAVLACQAGGAGVLLGGSGAETGLAARVAVHVALAARPDVLTARPGVGVDEAIALVHNETARTLAWIQARRVGH